MGLFDKAKDFVTDKDNVEKAREQLTDERVDAATDRLKDLAPDKADGAIDQLGDRVKAWGGNEQEEGRQTERRAAEQAGEQRGHEGR
ncbi:MAG TPA: hypothetical protein VKY86_09210 [Promicromonospora sp.]|nr:hypothetical protein [Promicromonospora sp.]